MQIYNISTTYHSKVTAKLKTSTQGTQLPQAHAWTAYIAPCTIQDDIVST